MRCPSRAPKTAQSHPLYRYALEPPAQCEREHGHGDGTDEYDVARRHKCGELLWWDPSIILVAGKPHQPSTGPFRLLGETVT